MKKAREVKKMKMPFKFMFGALGALLTWRILGIASVGMKIGFDKVDLTPIGLFSPSTPFMNSTMSILYAFLVFIMVPMGISVYEDQRKKTRTGEDVGSSKWTDPSYSLQFRDKDYLNNIIFTKTELYSRNNSVTKRNRNVILLGRPGTGKSRYFFKPNILQHVNGTLFITDPKGELLQDCGHALEEARYTVKCLNLDEMWNSNHYNPFNYLKFQNIKTHEVAVNLSNNQLKSKEWKLVDADVLQVINSIMRNTNGEGNTGGGKDPFWDKAEELYLQSIIYYIVYNYPKEKHNFDSVLDLMRKSESEDEESPSELDFMFDQWEHGQYVSDDKRRPIFNDPEQQKNQYGEETDYVDKDAVEGMKVIGEDGEPTNTKTWIERQPQEERSNYAVDDNGYVRRLKWINEFGVECKAEGTENIGLKQWHHFKSGVKSEKTMATIMLSASARLAPLNIPEVAEFMNDDDMELQRLGTRAEKDEFGNEIPRTGGKIVWFIITKPNETKFNFIASLFYTQAFQVIDIIAKNNNNSCPVPVDFYLDEWAQLGEIPRFNETLAYVRSLNVGIVVCLQSLDQLKEKYKDSWQTTIDCCDYFLYLGATSKDTLEYIVTLLGKETNYKKSHSKSYGKSGSNSWSQDTVQRDLSDVYETRSLGKGNCILIDMVSEGGAAYFSELYDLNSHPRYNMLFESWHADDPENLKKKYSHRKNLEKRQVEKEYDKFFEDCGLEPQKMTFKSRIIDEDEEYPMDANSAMYNPTDFLKEFSDNSTK